MIEIYNNYLNKIPENFMLLLKALSHKTRITLVLLLMENENLSLARIAKAINQKNSLILNHIKKLELAGIVQNYFKKSETTNEYSFYELTDYGKKIFSDLIKSYNSFFKNIQDKNKMIQISYQKEIPEEFILTLKAISNKIRYALSLLLIDQKLLSFSKIENILKKEKSSIANHLKILEIGGIIQNFFKKKADTRDYSYYEITNYGITIVNGLILSYNDYYKSITQVQEVSL
ncbi:MAG: winged helix-turn-helix transcriptional regulator [Promethearchaeota archaeon]